MSTSITLTGIDERVSYKDISKMQRPFVEFGILLSRKHLGSLRYPGLDWIKGLPAGNYALHLCGAISKEFRQGTLPAEFQEIGHLISRVQLNGFDVEDLDTLPIVEGKKLILQVRNQEQLHELVQKFPKTRSDLEILYDPSGGKGLFFGSFPTIPLRNYYRLGYAGGLSASNIWNVLCDIQAVSSDYWIDMESGVRTDNLFDVSKALEVIETYEDFSRSLS